MYCRDEETRREIVKNYELHPIAHVQLLNGQTKESCTGDTLTDAYYCFSYSARTGDDNGTLLCGKHAAENFLQLINHPRLPLFNPLSAQQSGSGGGGGVSSGKQVIWDATAKQLSDAINLLIICWSSPPGFVLADIKQNLEKFPDRTPFPSKIKSVNTIIGKDKQKRTLSKMLGELSQSNKLKAYKFDLLDAILANEQIASNFT